MIAQFLPYKSEIVIEKCIIAGITDTNPDMINRFRHTKFESLKEEEGGGGYRTPRNAPPFVFRDR